MQTSAINNTRISHYAQSPIPPTAIHLGDRPGSRRDTASIITMQTHAHVSDASSNMNVSPVIMESTRTKNVDLPNRKHLCQPLNPLNNPSPVKTCILERLLSGYDATKLTQLIDGLKLGFKIPYNGPIISVDSSNHRSTELLKTVVSDKLQSEREKARIAGPFSSPPLQNFH